MFSCWTLITGGRGGHTVCLNHLQVIEDTEHHSKAHVNDADDNRHLHLVRVEKGEPVHRHVPNLTKRQKSTSAKKKKEKIQRGSSSVWIIFCLGEFTHRVDAKRVGPSENAADIGVQREQNICLEGFISADRKKN